MKTAGLIDVENRHDPRHNGQTTSDYRFTGLIEEATKSGTHRPERKAAAKSRKNGPFDRRAPQPDRSIRVAEDTLPVETIRNIKRPHADHHEATAVREWPAINGDIAGQRFH